MIRLLFTLFFIGLLGLNQTTAQCGKRYQERYFNSIQIFRDVVYSQNAPALIAATLTTETTINKDLVMDIFTPPVTDTVTKRPVVILAHGGGFINVAFMGGTVLVGTMDNEDVQALADTLAHWGFVTASIEYRLGFNVASPSSLKRAVWRGAQDMSAAMRFFRKNANWFNIDTDRIFTGGSSAGAFCAIHSTFVDDAERIPESFELVPILKKDLGRLHSRPVVELTSFNPFSGNNVLGDDVDSLATGIAAYWGAIADLDWLHMGNNKAPMIMFHGTNDIVVDHECKRPFSGVILTAPVTCGSSKIDSVMNVYNMPHETHIEQGLGHEYWGVLNGDWLPSGPNAYWRDIIDKTSNYFYRIMQPAAPSVTGPDTVMSMVNYTYSIVNPDPNMSYCWEVTGGVIVSPVTNGNSIQVQFYSTTNQGFVTARAVDRAQVASPNALWVSTVRTNIAVNKLPAAILKAQIQPNPMHSQGSLVLESNQSVQLQAVVHNMLGQVIWQQAIDVFPGSTTINLPVDQLRAGTYSMGLSHPTGQWTQRFIVQ